MTNHEQNSAEVEAEKILKAEFSKAQAEDCPQGDKCAVHFRNDEEYVVEDERYARYITYVGGWAVVTDDNHVYDNPALLLRVALGLVKRTEIPDRWETCIFKVDDGTLADLLDKPDDVRQDSLRYSVTHDVWSDLKSTHEATVVMLEAGLIDLSKPVVD